MTTIVISFPILASEHNHCQENLFEVNSCRIMESQQIAVLESHKNAALCWVTIVGCLLRRRSDFSLYFQWWQRRRRSASNTQYLLYFSKVGTRISNTTTPPKTFHQHVLPRIKIFTKIFHQSYRLLAAVKKREKASFRIICFESRAKCDFERKLPKRLRRSAYSVASACPNQNDKKESNWNNSLS